MSYDFKVNFLPVYINKAVFGWSDEYRSVMSDYALSCIESVYSYMNKTKLTTKNSTLTDRMDGGIYCLCFGTGMIMYRVEVGANNDDLIFSGYFIPMSSLRTAWKVFRREVIYICVCGSASQKNNPVTKNAEEIFNWAANSKDRLEEKTLAAAEKIIEDTENADTPYSFAYTEFPLKKLPVVFESAPGLDTDMQESADDGIILLKSETVRKNTAKLSKVIPEAKYMRLCVNRKKTYINIKKEEYKAVLNKSVLKTKLKALDDISALDDELLWFFTKKSESDYSVLLEEPYINRFKEGIMDFYVVPSAMTHAITVINGELQQAGSDSFTTEDENKNGGFFSKIFSGIKKK